MLFVPRFPLEIILVLFVKRFPLKGIRVLFVSRFPPERIRVFFVSKFSLGPRLDVPDLLSPLTFTSGVAPFEVFPSPLTIG